MLFLSSKDGESNLVLRSESYFSLPSSLSLVLLTVMPVAYSEVPARRDSAMPPSRSSKVGSFLRDTVRVTPGDYDGSTGTVNFFLRDNEQPVWLQIGFIGQAEASIGIGYRYLHKGQNPYQDYFCGGYCSVDSKSISEKKVGEKKENKTINRSRGLRWNAGLEWAKAGGQFTLNFYGLEYMLREGITNYQKEHRGASLRLSFYPMQKARIMSAFRAIPIVFAAGTYVDSIKNSKVESHELVWHAGGALRLESQYLALEGGLCWDQREKNDPVFFGLHPRIAVEINFSGYRHREVSYAGYRARDVPQAYRPVCYYKASGPEEYLFPNHAP